MLRGNLNKQLARLDQTSLLTILEGSAISAKKVKIKGTKIMYSGVPLELDKARFML